MMQLNQKILLIYPELEFIPNHPFNPLYVIQDDGQGAYIRAWNYSKPKPTEEQLNSL